MFEGLKIYNPDGVFTATALHKVIMNSKSNGALRDIYRTKHDRGCVGLVNDFMVPFNMYLLMIGTKVTTMAEFRLAYHVPPDNP